ncbi:MAG: peptidase C39 family protein [Parcubacteria group bacterium]|nr:peptidase C39 family protein [Parcubacteria group bacterium]
MKLKVPFYEQDTNYTCGPAVLQMAMSFFGHLKSEKFLTKKAKTTTDGTGHRGLINAAIKEGFYCYANNNSSINEIRHFIGLGMPIIVHYREPSDEDDHYAIVTGFKNDEIILNDPWNGPSFRLKIKDFIERWYGLVGRRLHKQWILVISDKAFSIGKQYKPVKKS